tara:strand:- start:299 stop:1987 length:1689 start_codon:yes stop_codon:yes gene_type:complete
MKGRKGSVGTLNSKDSKTRTTSSGFRAAAKLAVGLAKGRARAASTAAANDITPPPPPTPVAAPTRSKIVAINVAMNARAPFLAWLRTRGWRQLKPLPGVLKLQSLCATHGAQAMALGAPMATPNAPLAYDVVLASARFVSRKSAFGVLSKSLDAVCVVAIVCMNAPDVEKVVAAFTGVAELAAPGGGWPRGAPKLPHATPCRYVAIYDAADVALARECRDQIEALEGELPPLEHILVDSSARAAQIASCEEPLVRALLSASTKTKQQKMVGDLCSAPPPLVAADEISLAAVLHHEPLRAIFREQLESEFSPESIEFWEAVQPFREGCRAAPPEGLGRWLGKAKGIAAKFVGDDTPKPINIPYKMVVAVRERMDTLTVAEASDAGLLDSDHVELLATTFDAAEVELLKLMERDAFARFKRVTLFEGVQREYLSAIAVSAATATEVEGGSSDRGCGSTTLELLARGPKVRRKAAAAAAAEAEAEAAADEEEEGSVVAPVAVSDDDDTTMYLFLDGVNEVQGPFSVTVLADWHGAEMLLDHTLVARYGDSSWEPLGEMLAARSRA